MANKVEDTPGQGGGIFHCIFSSGLLWFSDELAPRVFPLFKFFFDHSYIFAPAFPDVQRLNDSVVPLDFRGIVAASPGVFD